MVRMCEHLSKYQIVGIRCPSFSESHKRMNGDLDFCLTLTKIRDMKQV